MIVLAIAPGIRALAYAALRFEEHRLRAKVISTAVMHHTGRQYSFASPEEMVKRANVHWLSLQMCFERYVPGVLAICPAAQKSEPEAYVEACRKILRTAAITFNVPTIEYHDEQELLEDLGIRQKDLVPLIKRVLPHHTKNRYTYRVIGGGVAAAVQMLELREELVACATSPAKGKSTQ